MTNLQIKDVPEDLHAEIRRRAKESGATISDYLLEVLRRQCALPTRQDWLRRLHELEPVDVPPGVVASIVREGRELGLREASARR